MQGLAVVLFPVLLILFALAMERVESRLSRLNVREQEVQEFLDRANTAEVAALAQGSMPDALARFQRRRNPGSNKSLEADDDRELSARKAS
ncbi:hypothetical protein [Antrihabitans cavernicola]|uniref:Uncharacterized protein n=1 Tax=Antrihabitans cavernicola TaxID=2495913 RepID=A0A5A7SG97_9NOCA|nr:hypothetical protein [Spelaeibacter cavernicola]KAA0024469.1 hypothetical protein FOY51_00410 [Spelaeibacter cavernicola]